MFLNYELPDELVVKSAIKYSSKWITLVSKGFLSDQECEFREFDMLSPNVASSVNKMSIKLLVNQPAIQQQNSSCAA